MNKYTFDDVEIGQKEQFSVTITEKMLEDFRYITGDCNPLHNDVMFAKRKGYDNKVVYGMLTSSFLSTLAGVYLPGENSVIYEAEQKFLNPVFVGDKLEISGTVVEKNETFQFFLMKVDIRNHKKQKVVRGKMKVGFLNG